MHHCVVGFCILWLIACHSPEQTIEVSPRGVPDGRQVLGTSAGLHPFPIADLAFSTDGHLLATASNNLTRVWDVATGTLIREFVGSSARIWAVDLSARGDLLASGGEDGSLSVRALPDGSPRKPLKGHAGAIQCLRFSRDGRTLLSSSADGEIRVWDVENGIQACAFRGASVSADLSFSPDGKLVASGEGSKVILRDLSTGKSLAELEGQDRPVTRVRFSPAGDRIVGLATRGDDVEDHAVCLWEVRSGKLLRRFAGKEKKFEDCAFSGDGRLLYTVTNDAAIQIWEVDQGREVGRLSLDAREVHPATFSADGRWLAAGSPSSLRFRLWSADLEKRVVREIRPVVGHETAVVACRSLPDGRSLRSLDDNGMLLEWSLPSGEVRGRRFLREFWGDGMGFSPDARMAGLGCFLFDASTGKALRRVGDSLINCGAIGFSHDGDVVAVGEKGALGKIQTFSVRTGPALLELSHGRKPSTTQILFSPDDALLVCASDDDFIDVFDARQGKHQRTLSGHTDAITGLCSSPDGRVLASGSRDRTVRLWSLIEGKELARFQEDDPVTSVAFSPDGRELLSGTESGISHWDVPTAKRVRRYQTPHRVTCVDWLAPGRLAVSGSVDTTLVLWDLYDARAFPSSNRDLRDHWQTIGGEDPVAAHASMAAFLAAPRETVEFLQGVLKPIHEDPEVLRKLVEELDRDDPSQRESSYRLLRAKAPFASSELANVLAHSSSAEVKSRIRTILGELENGVIMPGEHLRRIRAIKLLELLDGAEPRRILKVVADGAASTQERLAAKAALLRLSAR
jgi:WD40 repeat protein